jgi:signal transduction histidine kinase
VRLTAEEVAGTVEVTVRDDGSGIAPEDLPHVFEPFYRGEGGSRGRTPRPGMGLGLAIVERLVAAMGGEVSLESKGKGMGTTARVRLPAAETNP